MPKINKPTEIEIALGLLIAVGENSSLTQRSIASTLELENANLTRCVRKGLIKVQQVPRNRYAFYLTLRGFAEKRSLTSAYLSISFSFFSEARRKKRLESLSLRPSSDRNELLL